MKSFLRNLIIAINICTLTVACTPKVCPAYYSSFYIPNADSIFFSYYENQNDTLTPKTEGLFASRDYEWNGLLAERGNRLDKFLDNEEKKWPYSNYPKVIVGIKHWPPADTTAMDDSLIYDVEYDSTGLTDPEDIIALRKAAAESGMIQKKRDSLPPMMSDQLSYMVLYGQYLLAKPDTTDSIAADTLAVDSLADSRMLNAERKWWQFWKPKYLDIESDSVSMDSVTDYSDLFVTPIDSTALEPTIEETDDW